MFLVGERKPTCTRRTPLWKASGQEATDLTTATPRHILLLLYFLSCFSSELLPYDYLVMSSLKRGTQLSLGALMHSQTFLVHQCFVINLVLLFVILILTHIPKTILLQFTSIILGNVTFQRFRFYLQTGVEASSFFLLLSRGRIQPHKAVIAQDDGCTTR